MEDDLSGESVFDYRSDSEEDLSSNIVDISTILKERAADTTLERMTRVTIDRIVQKALEERKWL